MDCNSPLENGTINLSSKAGSLVMGAETRFAQNIEVVPADPSGSADHSTGAVQLLNCRSRSYISVEAPSLPTNIEDGVIVEQMSRVILALV